MHGNWLADDKAIADEFSDRLSRVGVRDFVDFIGIEPDLALAAAHDGRREALLGCEVHPGRRSRISLRSIRIRNDELMIPSLRLSHLKSVCRAEVASAGGMTTYILIRRWR